MTIVKIQSATGNGTTITLNNVVQGNLVAVQDSYFRNPSTGVGEAVPTDSQGVFSVLRADAPQVLTSQDAGTGIFYQWNVAPGTHTITPQANTGHNTTVAEFSGFGTTDPLGVTVTSGKNSGTGTSQSTGTTATTIRADALALVAFCMAATITGSTNVGLTDPITNYITLQLNQNDATDVVTQHAYRILTASGTQAVIFNWTNSESDQFWEASIGTLYGAIPPGNDYREFPKQMLAARFQGQQI